MAISCLCLYPVWLYPGATVCHLVREHFHTADLVVTGAVVGSSFGRQTDDVIDCKVCLTVSHDLDGGHPWYF